MSERHEDENGCLERLAPSEIHSYMVDSAVKGNWTRYIAHSCNPNTRFELKNIGQRNLLVIGVVRDIDFGEELTINYGKDYFSELGMPCKCGFAKCKMWNEKNIKGRRQPSRRRRKDRLLQNGQWRTTLYQKSNA